MELRLIYDNVLMNNSIPRAFVYLYSFFLHLDHQIHNVLDGQLIKNA